MTDDLTCKIIVKWLQRIKDFDKNEIRVAFYNDACMLVVKFIFHFV